MVCSGAVTAQYFVGKAIRDGIYFSQFDQTTYWKIMLVTSAVSIGLAVANTRLTARFPPSKLVPSMFCAGAMLFVVEWLLIERMPHVVAAGLFLHISGFGPMLGSGFWLITSERFDPRTAKRRIGQIAAAGTLVGVATGLVTASLIPMVGTVVMLPVLAGLTLFAAWYVSRLAAPASPVNPARTPSPKAVAHGDTASGFKVLAKAPYLRTLALLLLLGTMSAMFFDQIMKGAAQDAFKSRDVLSQFFGIYYAGIGFITFIVQAATSRRVLERFGLSAAVSSPSAWLLAGGAGTLAAPGLASTLLARSGESVCRLSLFRTGYELFYAPIAPADKRAVKTIIDVGAERLGDAAASGMIPLLLMAPLAVQRSLIVWAGMASSAVALVLAQRLNRGYIQALEKGLIDRAVDLDLSEVAESTTHATIARTLGELTGVSVERPAVDAEVAAILALRSGDPDAAVRILNDERGLSAALVPHVIPLLARGSLAAETIRALRRVAEERLGALLDALLDPNEDFVIRRRLARVFSICVSQRAADGLLLALDDLRFEVRFQCARSLAAIVERNPTIRLDRDRIFAAIQREVRVARPVWEGRRLVDDVALEDAPSAVDEFLQQQASQSLAHVLTLLSLVLPKEPLKIAFRGLHTDNQHLRGTALEYFDGILPPSIREALWPVLESTTSGSVIAIPRADTGH